MRGIPYSSEQMPLDEHPRAIAKAVESDDEHDGGDATVDDTQGTDLEVIAYLIDSPCDEQPPAEGTSDDTEEADDVKPPAFGTGIKQEIGAGEEYQEEEYDGRIAHCEAKAREEILEDTQRIDAVLDLGCRSNIVTTGCKRSGWIAVPEIDAIKDDECRADKLQRDFILLDGIDYKAHGEDGEERVEEV